MVIAANQYIYQQLADGYTVRRHIDDPVFNMKQMLQNVCFQFNNERIVVELPPDYYAMGDIYGLDANNITKIRIMRDCK